MESEGGGVSFWGKMDDGKVFKFFTDYDIAFFDMPEGYVGSQLVDVGPRDRDQDFRDLREKPFFSCYLDWIEPIFESKFRR